MTKRVLAPLSMAAPDVIGSIHCRSRRHTVEETQITSETWTALWATLGCGVLGALFLFLALPDRAFLHTMRCDLDQPGAVVSKRHQGEQVRLFCLSHPTTHENDSQPSLFGKPSRHKQEPRP